MARVSKHEHVDAIVIGGGFYGCCLALFLRSIYSRVVVLEETGELLGRASLVNQARIHTGFHYPRSFVTARRSLALYERFMSEFRDAVVDDFVMLYAISRHGSKVTPQRFEKMYRDMGAPIANGSDTEKALFNSEQISGVYRCSEFAFDALVLRELLRSRMASLDVDVQLSCPAISIEPDGKEIHVQSADNIVRSAPLVIDATYGQMAAKGGPSAPAQPLKYELTELALIDPPEALKGLGITVMDGPFFSVMPFPAKDCYSLTHVRYTPHRAWVSGENPPKLIDPPKSNWLHMQRDARRFMPCLNDINWKGSLYETKTVLLRNERDDGRPILLAKRDETPGLITVLGGKLDNIYDLFDALRGIGGKLAEADDGFVSGSEKDRSS